MRKPAFLFIVLGLFVLAGLFFLLQPDTESGAYPDTLPAMPSRKSSEEPRTYRLVVQQGQRISGPRLIRVRQGQEVTLVVTSDRSDELHLHGYDLHTHLHPGKPNEIAFTADHTGRFDFELHEADQVLGAIEVLPR